MGDYYEESTDMVSEERREELAEWKKRIPMLIEAVEDRALMLNRYGLPGKAREFEQLLDWLKNDNRCEP